MATKTFSTKTKEAAWTTIGAIGLLFLAATADADPVRVGVNGSRPVSGARPVGPARPVHPGPGRPVPVVRPAPPRPVHPGRPPVVRPGHPRRPGRPVVIPSRRPVVRPVRVGDTADQRAEYIIRRAMLEGGCGQLAEIVRRLSNQLASDFQWASRPGALPPAGDDMAGRARERNRRVIIDEMARSREFWERIWERITEAYRSCDYECFDDGEAVGRMSGLGYCAASVAAEGLPAPGVAITPPLPLCETAIFAGCERGYRAAASDYEGCRAYATGDYDSIFREFMSQDCQIPDGEEDGEGF